MRFALVEFDERNYNKLIGKSHFSVIELPSVYGHQIRFLSKKEIEVLKEVSLNE